MVFGKAPLTTLMDFLGLRNPIVGYPTSFGYFTLLPNTPITQGQIKELLNP